MTTAKEVAERLQRTHEVSAEIMDAIVQLVIALEDEDFDRIDIEMVWAPRDIRFEARITKI